MLVLISVKTGLYLGPWAVVVIDLRVKIALHDIFLIVPFVRACPTAWGIGNLHQTVAVEEEPRPSAVGRKFPGAVEMVEEEAFDRFRRLVSVEAAVFNSELLCHRVGKFLTSSDISPKALCVLLSLQPEGQLTAGLPGRSGGISARLGL